MQKTTLILAAFATLATAAHADSLSAPMQRYFENEISLWLTDPAIVTAINRQNTRNAGLIEADILALDTRWRAEVGQANTPTITPVITGAAADFLRAQIAASGGIVAEVFIMDEHGLNVAASGTTSDYWQGDEAKFTETYSRGAGAIHVSDVEFDESANGYLGQVSAPIVDPATNTVIGAITVGLNAEMLF